MARAAGPGGAAGIFLLGSGGWRGSDGSGVLFDGHAQLEKGALVLGVLFHDGLGNRLGALELRAGIEIHALFAAVNLVAATRAGAIRIETRRQNVAATSAPRVENRANHAGSAGADLLLAWGAGMLLFLGRPLSLFGLAGILVTMLTIFSIQTNLFGIHSFGAG